MMLFLSSLVGLCLGSFANVCIYRIPRKISVVAPRSFCPKCRRTLSWYELIPLLSFLFQKGKCRRCGNRISIRYPFVELFSGVMSLWLFSQYGVTPATFVKLALMVLFLIIAVIDWTFLVIPNGLIISGLVLGGAAFYLVSVHALLNAVLSAVLAAAFTFLARAIGNFAFKKETMGFGDVKLAGLIGFFIGFEYFLVAVWLSAIVGIVYWTAMRLFKKADWDIRLPFGSFLAATFLLLYFAPFPVFHIFPNFTIPLFQLPFIH